MKVIDRLQRKYSGETDNIREKVKTLFQINTILAAFFLLFALLRLMSASYIVAAGELLVVLIILINLAFLFSGRYRVCSNLSLTLFLAAAFGIFLIQEHQEANDIYIYSTYIISVICITPLLSYRLRQMVGILSLSVLGQILLIIFLFLPMTRLTGESDTMGKFVISVSFLVMAGSFAALVFRLQLRTIEMVNREKDKSNQTVEDLNKLVQDMGDSFNMGEQLQNASAETSRCSENISESLNELNHISRDLMESTENAGGAYEQISRSEKTVKDQISIQTEALSLSTNSVDTIVDRINTMYATMRDKLAIVEELNRSSLQGSEKLEESLESIKRLAQSSSEILDVIKVIENISERTNLLAMNAAIEAAHAGESGKGFAVVAGEIRSLSEGTAANSGAIRTSIESNNRYYSASSQAIDELKQVFDRITLQISDVGQTLTETVESMESLQDGAGEITKAMGNLLQSNEDVNRSLQSMEKDIGDGETSVSLIKESVENTDETITSLTVMGNTIVHESAALKSLGAENIENVKNLAKRIKSIE